jgi:hypothetical protein
MTNFLDTLGAKEKQCIKDRTGVLINLLGEWAQRHPLIRPVRLPMIALTTATVMPRVSIPNALTWAQTVAWIFAIDDKADPQTFTPEDMRHKAEQWYSTASNWPASDVDDSDELTMIVVDMTRDLSKSRMFEPLRKYWALRLRNHIRGVAQKFQDALEYRDHGPRALPSLDRYLRVGVHSMGFPFLGSMAMIFHEDFSVMGRVKPISKAMECASTALRLYNDVATLSKEIQVREVNPILIVYHAMLCESPNAIGENVLSEAKQRILRLADSYAQRCCDLVGRLKTDSGQIEETSYRLVALHAYFYGHTEQDYHTTSLAKMYQMFDGSTS